MEVEGPRKQESVKVFSLCSLNSFALSLNFNRKEENNTFKLSANFQLPHKMGPQQQIS